MADLHPRDTQTKVKHEILSKYLDVWGGIIIGGLINSKRKTQKHFIYVDCFSYTGKYLGEKEDSVQNKSAETVYGSPIIGVMALDRLVSFAQKMGVSVRVNSILIEKDKKRYEELINTLNEAGFSNRLVETTDFHNLSSGQIAIVNADATTIPNQLLSYTTQPDTWAFYLLDPYGPSGIPRDFVEKIIRQERHDVMINFIYEDLPRKGGLALKENLKPELKQQVDNWSNAFGSDNWINIARVLSEQDNEFMRNDEKEFAEKRPLTSDEIADLKEHRFVEAYLEVLSSIDSSLTIKLVNLKFSDKERTIFYLFLTTHDANGALALNEVLHNAKLLEYELRYRLQLIKRTAPPPGQPHLFPLQDEELVPPKPEKPSRPTNEEIGKVITDMFSGKQVTKKDILKELANTFFFRSEVDKALRYLRKQKLVEFEGDPRQYTSFTFH
ncbi:MAG: three-Cys-motif partner protein TcmP [Anaerolineales bacterium]|nr:three-Cys-motif partner protein TcmP [Anaerolineales bacterium]MCB9146315.1 three-Cys-motif partner protein TcmP [Anaerolineales bacterium]